MEVYDNASVSSLEITKLWVYPNPVSDKLTIKIDGENENMDVVMYDVFEKKVRAQLLEVTQNNIHNTINVSDLVSGPYLLLLRGDNEVKTI